VSETIQPISVNRILVSLDNSTHSTAALEAAVELARHYNAEIRGVFIEDITLLNLSKMPFCQEVGEHTATVRKITTEGVSRGIHVQSRWVIKSFRKITNSTGINAAFVVLRGGVHQMIEQEAQSCDLIVIGKTGTNPLRGRRLGSTAKALIEKHTKPLLLIEEHTHLGYPMIVKYSPTPFGKTSLETARALLNPEETLVILLNKDDPHHFSQEITQLQQWAAEHNIKVSFEGVKTGASQTFFRMLNGLKTGLLILPHEETVRELGFMRRCLDEVRLPILLIRDNG